MLYAVSWNEAGSTHKKQGVLPDIATLSVAVDSDINHCRALTICRKPQRDALHCNAICRQRVGFLVSAGGPRLPTSRPSPTQLIQEKRLLLLSSARAQEHLHEQCRSLRIGSKKTQARPWPTRGLSLDRLKQTGLTTDQQHFLRTPVIISNRLTPLQAKETV